MITKDNEPIILMRDGGYTVQHGQYRYVVRDSDKRGLYKTIDIVDYIADHPEALIPEPLPPEPTKEQKSTQEIQSLLSYLDSTDWYIIRGNETGETIPKDVLTKRQAARDRISELRKV